MLAALYRQIAEYGIKNFQTFEYDTRFYPNLRQSSTAESDKLVRVYRGYLI